MWPNVMAGQAAYISPFTHKADITVDSAFAYEVPVLKRFSLRAFEQVTEDPSGVLEKLIPALYEFEEIGCEHVPEDSILREFIGGGVYKY